MKSVTVKDKHGHLLFKVLEHKDGTYTITTLRLFEPTQIDIRDNNGKKVYVK